jgi:hypothetical protein
MDATTDGSKKPAGTKADREMEEALEAYGKIESESPGRIRVRIKAGLRTPERMAEIQKTLRKHPSVTDVQVNERTGSIVVTYKKGDDGRDILKDALGEAALVAAAIFEIPASSEEEGGGDPYAKLDQQLADLVYRMERVVYRKTGLHFRGQVIAGTVAGVGVAQMAIVGISLEMLPGPVLLWIAWDIYHRVSQEPPVPEEETAAAQNAPTDMRAADPRPA